MEEESNVCVKRLRAPPINPSTSKEPVVPAVNPSTSKEPVVPAVNPSTPKEPVVPAVNPSTPKESVAPAVNPLPSKGPITPAVNPSTPKEPVTPAVSPSTSKKPAASAEQINHPGSPAPIDPYKFSDSEDNLALCNFVSYENDLKVKFQKEDVCVLGKTSKSFDLVKVLEVLPKNKKIEVMYLEKKKDRHIAPFAKQYRDPFKVRFNHLVYRLNNKDYLTIEEEATIKEVLMDTFNH